jgi:hypothetical protein
MMVRLANRTYEVEALVNMLLDGRMEPSDIVWALRKC